MLLVQPVLAAPVPPSRDERGRLRRVRIGKVAAGRHGEPLSPAPGFAEGVASHLERAPVGRQRDKLGPGEIYRSQGVELAGANPAADERRVSIEH